VIELGVGEHDALERYMANRLVGDRVQGQVAELIAYVGGSVQEKPATTINTDCG
jgi:hypothetical protein